MAKTLDQLKQEAERKCTTKGHRLGNWTDLGVWHYAECSHCSSWVAINTKGQIVGPAVQVECCKENQS